MEAGDQGSKLSRYARIGLQYTADTGEIGQI